MKSCRELWGGSGRAGVTGLPVGVWCLVMGRCVVPLDQLAGWMCGGGVWGGRQWRRRGLLGGARIFGHVADRAGALTHRRREWAAGACWWRWARSGWAGCVGRAQGRGRAAGWVRRIVAAGGLGALGRRGTASGGSVVDGARASASGAADRRLAAFFAAFLVLLPVMGDSLVESCRAWGSRPRLDG